MNQAEALTKSQTASSSQSAWRAYALLRPTFCLIYFLDDGIKGGTNADPVDWLTLVYIRLVLNTKMSLPVNPAS